MGFTMNLEFLGFPDYEVDEDGNVYSHLSKRNLKWSISPQHHDKYAKVMLTKADKSGTKFITVHRLVAYSFLPKPFGKNYVNHIDGNIHNNCVSNLEWVTALENNLHSIDKVRKPQFLITDIDLPERGDYKDRGKGRELTFSEEEAIQYCEYMMQGYRACDLRVMMNIAGKIYINPDGVHCWTFGKNIDKPVLSDYGFLNWVLANDFPLDTKRKLRLLIEKNK